jgi:hypothetical protein
MEISDRERPTGRRFPFRPSDTTYRSEGQFVARRIMGMMPDVGGLPCASVPGYEAMSGITQCSGAVQDTRVWYIPSVAAHSLMEGMR